MMFEPEDLQNLVGGVAESYEVSDDGTVYTFHLREGVVFPDGTPFNADAVVFSFERIADIAAIEGENPFRYDMRGNGLQESSGTFWLLPYWMARYYGFIQP